VFPIINSFTGCLYNSILYRSLWTSVMAPGDSSRAPVWWFGSPQRLAHLSQKENVIWIPQAHVHTHTHTQRAPHSGDLLRWLLFWHRKYLSDASADSIHMHYNELRFHNRKPHVDIYISFIWHVLSVQIEWRRILLCSPTPSHKVNLSSQVCNSNRSCKMLQFPAGCSHRRQKSLDSPKHHFLCRIPKHGREL
jgi:hypothetical protein